MMTKRWNDVRVNVDLHAKAPCYIDLLASHLTAKFSNLATDEDWLRQAVCRYERNWLPLAADWKGAGELEPPRDVLWVWHLHMLNPRHYEAYCVSRFQRVVAHKLHVKYLHFRLLQNRWTNFNQTWHKSSLGEGDSELYK